MTDAPTLFEHIANVNEGKRKMFRFDGTITAGNIITVCLVIVPLIAGYVRLEDRVATEETMRIHLETRVESGFTQVTEAMASAAAASKDRADDIKTGLRRIDDKITQLFLADRGGPSTNNQNH